MKKKSQRGFVSHISKLCGGFTLIETLIYSGLFAIVVSFSVIIFYQIVSLEAQNRTRRDVETEADFLMRKIIWALNSTQSVSSPAAGATSSVLTLARYNFSGNPLTFDISLGTARLSRAGGVAVPLTGSNISITQMFFSHIAASGTVPEAVQVILSVAASTSEAVRKASTTLENTVYLK